MQQYHIYQIVNKINDKRYIGSAVDIADRWHLHRKMLNNGNHHSIKLQRAWNKYGEHNFIFEILDTTDDKNRLLADEQYWIDTSKSATKNGYNVAPIAGSQLGFKHSAKSKKLIGDVQRGRVSNRKGVKLSEETKQKLRDANVGKKRSPESIAKQLESRK